ELAHLLASSVDLLDRDDHPLLGTTLVLEGVAQLLVGHVTLFFEGTAPSFEAIAFLLPPGDEVARGFGTAGEAFEVIREGPSPLALELERGTTRCCFGADLLALGPLTLECGASGLDLFGRGNPLPVGLEQ